MVHLVPVRTTIRASELALGGAGTPPQPASISFGNAGAPANPSATGNLAGSSGNAPDLVPATPAEGEGPTMVEPSGNSTIQTHTRNDAGAVIIPDDYNKPAIAGYSPIDISLIIPYCLHYVDGLHSF
ncbi:hypothetical protein BV22DRAFT_1135651 [Leucogyrophana mollusca]|uniref:Uncharacterized protein n=1 Tax=Leucogyrophana mollusca TaxID=85980 RepID=A0ACB8AW03_9AGAM|nr:hypothetical protein BV22DRAFT_1135651 [Leucogyrophana mollusca]